jgi:hydrogenase maturation protease
MIPVFRARVISSNSSSIASKFPLMMSKNGTIVVIGVGNTYRSDDGVALRVVRRIRDLLLPGVTVVEGIADTTQLIETWGTATAVILVDCTVSKSKPGTIFRHDALQSTIPEALSRTCTTHGFGLSQAIELARGLGRLPSRLIVFGIEGKSFEPGTELSPEVEQAGGRVTNRIVDEIQSMLKWQVSN